MLLEVRGMLVIMEEGYGALKQLTRVKVQPRLQLPKETVQQQLSGKFWPT